MFGFSPLCATSLCSTWGEVELPPVVTLPPDGLAQLYGGGFMGRGKKKEKEKKPSLEEMVIAIAVDPGLGKEAVVRTMPKAVQRELMPDLRILEIYKLVDQVMVSSAAVRSDIVKLYAEMEEDDEDALIVMLM